MLTFRWSIWNVNDMRLKLLYRSMASFRRFFPDANYLVTAREPLPEIAAEVISSKGALFDTDALDPFKRGFATFRKFSPRFRMTTGPEIFCDLDVFALRFPKCIPEFLESDKEAMIQCRLGGDRDNRLGYGTFADKIHPDVPPCCVGFIGMKGNYDLTDDLVDVFYEAIESNNFFQEQGAVVKVMERDILDGKVFLASEEHIRYFTPGNYQIDLDNIPCDMVHCISSQQTNYKAFKMLLQRNLI